MQETKYDETVDDKLNRVTVSCGTHGELDNSQINIGLDGSLHCTYCSINQEMDVHNQQNINSQVDIDL